MNHPSSLTVHPFRYILLLTLAIFLLLIHNARTEGFSGDDKGFLLKGAENILFEINIAKIAQEKAVRPEVREFADMIVKEHTALYLEMKAIAGNAVTMPEGIGYEYRKRRDIPARRSGAAFDNAFLKQMKLAHESDLERFKDHAKETQNPRIKAFIEKANPAIKSHLDKIESFGPIKMYEVGPS